MSVEPAVAAEAKKFPKGPLVVLALVNVIDSIDVSILRGVLPLIGEDWGLSDLQLGLLGTAYIFVHTLATVPAGWFADNYRRTRIIGYTLLSWSVLSGLAAVAVNYVYLFLARASLGVGQAIDNPASASLTSDYYPAARRGRVFSWLTVSDFVGGAIGLGLGGFVGSVLGWRWAFALVGMPGSIIAITVFRLREPKRGEADGVDVDAVRPPNAPTSRRLGEFTRIAARQLTSELKSIFRIRTMRYILVGVGVLLFTVSGTGFWLAVYHQRYSGMSVAQSTAVTAFVLGLGGVIGTFWGGSIADRVYGRVRGGRIVVVAMGMLACTGFFLISYNVPIVWIRVLLQALGVLAIASAVPGIRASMMDVLPVQSRGVGTSAFGLIAALFGTALAPTLVGLISDLTSLLAAFYIVAPPIVIGSLILLKARDTIEEDARAIFAMLAERPEPGTPEEPEADGP